MYPLSEEWTVYHLTFY